jgi:hypothetical protein
MPKLKFDFKALKETLSSRYEILALVVASVLVVLCVLWGFSTLLGASSPEGDILKDKDKIAQKRRTGGGGAPTKEKQQKPKTLWDWPKASLSDPQLALYPYFSAGVTGSNLRADPRFLPIDDVVAYDIHQGIYTFQPAGEDGLEGVSLGGGDKGGHPTVIAKAKRLVVVSASFPYHKQVEEYRNALRLDKKEEVFTKSLAPTFEGLNVTRTKIAQNGKPIADPQRVDLYSFDPDTGALKIAAPIEKLLKECVYDERWIDKYYDVLYGSSATPLPLLTNNAEYKEIKLPGIGGRPAPPPKVDPKKVFNAALKPSVPYGMPRPNHMPTETKEAGQKRTFKLDELPPELQVQITLAKDKFNWFSPYGTMPEDNSNLAKAAGFKIGDGKLEISTNYRAPLKWDAAANPVALVQFIDVDVEPGATYQYDIQVRFANPNFGEQSGVEFAAVAEGKERVSPWVRTQPITIPNDDFQFSITNQDKFFTTVKSAKEPHIDTEISAKAIGNKMVPFQVQRFVDTVVDRGATHYVADWVIAERLLTARGEPIGRKCEIEVMEWNPRKTKYEFYDLQPPPKGVANAKPKIGKGMVVDFRIDPAVYLLDFTGGKQAYPNPKGGTQPATVEDDSAIDALLLMPDGTMKLRSAREEPEVMQARRDRYEQWRTRLEDAMIPPAPPPTKGPGKGGR